MIDLDRMEAQLERARVLDQREVASPPPERPPLRSVDPRTLDAAGLGSRVVELLRLGRFEEADAHRSAHARLAAATGDARHGRDAAAWATARAVLDGREDDARAGLGWLRALTDDSGDAEGRDRSWSLRFRVASAWGGDHERYDVLDHCRERAYRHDDPAWWGPLTLLLAQTGRLDEAVRAADVALAHVGAPGRTSDAGRAVVAADVMDAAALMGDGARLRRAWRSLAAYRSPLVVSATGDGCWGAAARFSALDAATTGRWEQADEGFRAAATLHRALGAMPLLALTLEQWGRSLAGRDGVRAADCREECASLRRALRLR